ncbi:uncharacterized protein LOC126783377 [Argentina anserina]|uniref:uncharacterized protein LOC126783377 n=1 Tax=Argentina anserina TaxID=57926 RepID=UPI0021765B73|nr:uncharacterized protein LOC126783377 [Potentilla anserina]
MPTPTKRSRICRSPSSADAAVIRQLPPRAPEPSDRRCAVFGNPVEPSPEKSRRELPSRKKAHREHPLPEKSHGGQQPPPAILTVSSPEIVSVEAAAAQVDQFLDECYFCKMRMPGDCDVFMYGAFGAFCSELCRFKQICKDRLAEQALVKCCRGRKSNVNGSGE